MPKFSDVYARVLIEVLDKTPAEVEAAYQKLREKYGEKANFDQEITQEDADQMLVEAMANPAALFNWMIRGLRK